MKRESLIWILLLLMASLTTGCRHGRTGREAPPPVKVGIASATVSSLPLTLSFSGTVEELQSTSLSFSLPGTVAGVYAGEGSKVRRGELLAILDQSGYRNAYELAEAKRVQAEDAFKRFQPMYRNSHLPEVKMVEVETGLRQARASAAMAKKNLDDCRILAPSDGIIGKRSLEPGVNVMPGVPVFTLLRIERVYVKIPVPENEIARVSKGQAAEVEIPALSGLKVQGRVEEIGVVADPFSRSYAVKVGLENPEGRILPGMVCRALLRFPQENLSLVVPYSAVQIDESGENFVYVVDLSRSRVTKRMVTVQNLMKEGISITRGLKSGEKVVVTGAQKLTEGSAVTTR